MPGDQAKRRFVDARALAVEESELPQRGVDSALMDQLLHAMQQLGAFGAIGFDRLLGEQLVDVRVAAIDISAALDDERLHARGGVAEGAAAALYDVAVLLLHVALIEGGALDRAQPEPNADLGQAIQRRLAEVGVGGVAVVLPAIEAAGETRLGQQL